MESIDLNSWTDFPDAVAGVRAKYQSRTIKTDAGDSFEHRNTILFRGLSNSEWELQTTLERATVQSFSVLSYLERAVRYVNAIESFTDKRWRIPPYPKLREMIAATQDIFHIDLPCYDFLVYLRHHGFPSPLLDWSTSPYVAAYFAFEPPTGGDECAVYVFIEQPRGHKSHRNAESIIKVMGPYTTTHIRHFTQNARYSFAAKWDGENTHFFCPHHEITGRDGDDQDVLIKISVPRSNRIAALKQLEDYNINHYTLFQSEDSLIRWLSLRAFDLNELSD